MLILPIKSKWFNMILSGDKQEEYREIKPYYTTRFKKIFEMYPNSNIPTGLDKQLIGFRNGYGSSRPQFTAVCSLDIKTGIKRDWQEWKRTKNRKDTYRNTPRENRRRKTERRASVETINTR